MNKMKVCKDNNMDLDEWKYGNLSFKVIFEYGLEEGRGCVLVCFFLGIV